MEDFDLIVTLGNIPSYVTKKETENSEDSFILSKKRNFCSIIALYIISVIHKLHFIEFLINRIEVREM